MQDLNTLFEQEGLEARGCVVTRLDTYDTVPVRELENEARQAARGAGVAAIASPSAVNAWVELIGGQEEADVAFACIGEKEPDTGGGRMRNRQTKVTLAQANHCLQE